MTKEEAKNIAIVLIAKSGIAFDAMAFDDCNPELSEKDQDKVIDEIERECLKMIEKIEKKLKVSFQKANSTPEIVDLILYEQ